MNKFSCSFTVVALIFFTSTAQSYKWNNPGGQLGTGYTHATYRSALMNNIEIGYVIYLPPGYNNSTERYPVLYSLHGMGGNENQNPSFYKDALQSGINNKTFSPMIVVFVNGRGNTFYSDSKDGQVKCESTIIQELIPHIDAAYRTKADRLHRAIEGFSMGGFGALMLGFKHYDMFCSIGSYDAALVNWDELSRQQFDRSIPTQIFGSDGNYFNENSYPFTFAKKNAEKIKSLGIKVTMTTGDQDLQMGPLYPFNCDMRDTLKNLGIDLTFKIIAGGGHGGSINKDDIGLHLKFHSNNFDAATKVFNPVFSLSSIVKRNLSPVTFSSADNLFFRIPSEWKQNSVKMVQVFNLNGKSLGRLSVEGIDCVNRSTMEKQFGSGVFTLKPVK